MPRQFACAARVCARVTRAARVCARVRAPVCSLLCLEVRTCSCSCGSRPHVSSVLTRAQDNQGPRYNFVVPPPIAPATAAAAPATATSTAEIRAALAATAAGSSLELQLAEGATLVVDDATPIEVVAKRLRLYSAGSGATLDAQRQSRHFWVVDGGVLELERIRLTNGHANYGGSIVALASSNVTLDECTISSATAVGPGAGIFSFHSTVTLRSSLITLCTARVGGGTPHLVKP